MCTVVLTLPHLIPQNGQTYPYNFKWVYLTIFLDQVLRGWDVYLLTLVLLCMILSHKLWCQCIQASQEMMRN